MSDNEFESSLLENAVNQLSRLPGIGRKTALRLALHLLRQQMSVGVSLGQSIIDLCNGIRYCSICHNISETEKEEFLKIFSKIDNDYNLKN